MSRWPTSQQPQGQPRLEEQQGEPDVARAMDMGDKVDRVTSPTKVEARKKAVDPKRYVVAEQCSRCGTTETTRRQHAHGEDRWLTGEILCRRCHEGDLGICEARKALGENTPVRRRTMKRITKRNPTVDAASNPPQLRFSRLLLQPCLVAFLKDPIAERRARQYAW